MGKGGARREPQASPMLKARFDARCHRRRGSPDSDEISFASRRKLSSRDRATQGPSSDSICFHEFGS